MLIEDLLRILADHLYTLKMHLRAKESGCIDIRHCIVCIERDINPCLNELFAELGEPSEISSWPERNFKIEEFLEGVETTINEIQCHIRNLEVLTHSICSLSERAKRFNV